MKVSGEGIGAMHAQEVSKAVPGRIKDGGGRSLIVMLPLLMEMKGK
jgi:hypothetical protein